MSIRKEVKMKTQKLLYNKEKRIYQIFVKQKKENYETRRIKNVRKPTL